MIKLTPTRCPKRGVHLDSRMLLLFLHQNRAVLLMMRIIIQAPSFLLTNLEKEDYSLPSQQIFYVQRRYECLLTPDEALSEVISQNLGIAQLLTKTTQLSDMLSLKPRGTSTTFGMVVWFKPRRSLCL